MSNRAGSGKQIVNPSTGKTSAGGQWTEQGRAVASGPPYDTEDGVTMAGAPTDYSVEEVSEAFRQAIRLTQLIGDMDEASFKHRVHVVAALAAGGRWTDAVDYKDPGYYGDDISGEDWYRDLLSRAWRPLEHMRNTSPDAFKVVVNGLAAEGRLGVDPVESVTVGAPVEGDVAVPSDAELQRVFDAFYPSGTRARRIKL